VNDSNPWTHLLMTLITLTGVAVIMWMEAPEWQRQLIARAARARLRAAATRVAASSGHHAMGDELSGRLREALAGYGFTEKISRIRDRL
jgi:hypothetical protein